MDVATIAAGLRAGERRALAKAITLVESERPADRCLAETLIGQILHDSGGARRIGVSGPPGAGKSTLIEHLGLHLIDTGHRVAVLAADPSSLVSGGSLMGDKTRMEQLGRSPAAFIRPSPVGRVLGGVTARAREVVLLCEAAGYDIVLIETVGVGQSEVSVHELADCLLLLVPPGTGDELQGMKRGIVELADLVVVTKADLFPDAALRTRADFSQALSLLRASRPPWQPRCLPVAASDRHSIEKLWSSVDTFFATLGQDRVDANRLTQAGRWLRRTVRELLWRQLLDHPQSGAMLRQAEADVLAGRVDPEIQARQVVRTILALFAPSAGDR